MITRVSCVIRPEGSDLIFDHPYNAYSVSRAAVLGCQRWRAGHSIMDGSKVQRVSGNNGLWITGVHVHGSGIWGNRFWCDWFAEVRRAAVRRGGHLVFFEMA
jgi:hypothetical protein